MALRRAMIQSVVQQFATMVISFLSGMVIARLLTPHEVGVYSVALAVMSLAGALKDFGISSYIVTDRAAGDQLLRAAYGLSVITSSLLAALLFFASWPVGNLYKDPEVGQVLRIIACGQMISPIGLPATMLLTRELRFGALHNIGIGAATCQAAVAIFLAFEGWSSSALGWSYLAFNIASAAGAVLYKPDTVLMLPTLVGTGKLLSFGGWMTGATLVGSASMQAPDLVIGRVLSLADTALYSQANKVTSIVRNAFFFALMRPVLPSLGEKDRAGEGLAALYLRIIETVTGFAWPAYALLAIWAHPLITLLYGPNWSAAAAVVAPLAISHSLEMAVTPHYDPLIIKRRVRTLFLSETGLFLLKFCVLTAATFLGLQAAAWSLALSGLFFVTCYYLVLKPIVGFRFNTLVTVWARSLIVAGSVALVAGVIRLTCADYPTLLGLALSAVFGGIAWVCAIKLTGHEFSGHIDELLRSTRSLFLRPGGHSRQ